jgi:hypothetical protein
LASARRGRQPPLRRIHEAVYDQDPEARRSLEYQRTGSTDEIVKSLQLDQKEPLRVKPDGRIVQGNTRIKVLEERGFPVDDLPRETIQ